MVQIPHLQLHCFPRCFFCLILCCSKSLLLLHRENRCSPLFCIPLAVSSAEEMSQGQNWLNPSILIPCQEMTTLSTQSSASSLSLSPQVLPLLFAHLSLCLLTLEISPSLLCSPGSDLCLCVQQARAVLSARLGVI